MQESLASMEPPLWRPGLLPAVRKVAAMMYAAGSTLAASAPRRYSTPDVAWALTVGKLARLPHETDDPKQL